MASSLTKAGRGSRSAGEADGDAGREHPPSRLLSRPAAVHLLILACYLVAGIIATWPRATQLGSGKVPDTTDTAQYVWNFWWLAHCVTHLQNPWLTKYMGAPFGVQLGFNTLMPLPCLLLVPVTLAFGPAASFTLMIIVLPGLLCYAMYRLARLWVTTQIAAIAAGALFGLATMLVWQDEAHVTFAAAEVFLPLTLEACVRLRRGAGNGRGAGNRQAIVLGVIVGVAFLVNQETAILPVILAGLTLVPWLLLALAVFEAGWFSTDKGLVPVALPALDRPIAADHSNSIVVDVPFGLRGGFPLYGAPMVPGSLLLGTEDGHPRAISYTSWVPATTTSADEHHPFYLGLVALQNHQPVPAWRLAAARADAAAMHVGWVLVWRWSKGLTGYLSGTGFRLDYRADNVAVYRAVRAG